MNGLHKILDQIYLDYLFPYLTHENVSDFVSTDSTLHQRLIRRVRHITLDDAGIVRFLFNQSFREKIYSRIIDPNKQLSMKRTVGSDNVAVASTINGKNSFIDELKEHFLPYSLLNEDFLFPSLHDFIGQYQDLLWLCEVLRMNAEFTIEKGNFSENDLQVLEWVAPHIHRITKELHLKRWIGSPLLNLASSLEVLVLRDCDRVRLPSLPHLKRLCIIGLTEVENLREFNGLPILQLEKQSSFDCTLLPHCKKLIMIGCIRITHCEALNCIESVEFKSCEIPSSMRLEKIKKLIITYDEDSMHFSSVNFLSDLSLDFSSHPNLEWFELNASCFEFNQPLVLDDHTLPISLKHISLIEFNDFLDMLWFENLHFLHLEKCVNVTSLIGLGKIQRIELDSLDELSSLDGLGGGVGYGNQYVSIRACQKVVDFSLLKHIKEVKIIYCLGFTNAFDVDHAHTLTLHACPCLRDISMLDHVQKLTIEGCNRIAWSSVLQIIPRVKIINCRYLSQSNLSNINSQSDMTPIYNRDFGVRMMNDSLSNSLPDHLYPIILQFLDRESCISFLSCNCFFYQHFMKKHREIIIEEEDNIVAFFSDVNYRNMFLCRIENPCKQLSINTTLYTWNFNMLSRIIDRDLMFPGLKSFSASRIFFEAMMAFIPQGISFIKTFDLLENEDEDEDEDEDEADHSPEEIAIRSSYFIQNNVHQQLSFEKVNFHLLNLLLPSTLEELTLNECQIINKPLLPLPPNLKKLSLTESFIPNLFQFNYIQELYLFRMTIKEDISPLNSIPKIQLIYCEGIKHYHGLQNNLDVTLQLNGSNRTRQSIDFSQCFANAKRIRITVFNSAATAVITNLSYYDQVESFHLNCCNVMNGSLNIDRVSNEFKFPKNLKSLTLKNIVYLKFMKKEDVRYLNQLKTFQLINCRGFINSFESVSNIPHVTFHSLSQFESLVTLPSLNLIQSIVIVEMVEISDFTPLSSIPSVTIERCPRLLELHNLEGVKQLRIELCSHLVKLTCWNGLTCLDIKSCNQLKYLVHDELVKELKIENCLFYEDIQRAITND